VVKQCAARTVCCKLAVPKFYFLVIRTEGSRNGYEEGVEEWEKQLRIMVYNTNPVGFEVLTAITSKKMYFLHLQGRSNG
jgi:hypothetical protein